LFFGFAPVLPVSHACGATGGATGGASAPSAARWKCSSRSCK